MSFPRYGSYEDSGIEWLGQVPSHWTVMPMKRGVRLVTEKAEGRSRAVALENVVSWTGKLLQTETEFDGEGIAFRPGDVLYGKLRPYLAKVHAVDFDGEAVGDFHVLRQTGGIESPFLAYFLLTREVVAELTSSTYGARMPRVGWEFMGMSPFVIPPTAEQRSIVTFLDQETAKIDALVEAQRRLIDLLKEKRQAVISHAVTKGLDPFAPMKDSGVEWLGKVPAHWEVASIKHAVELATSGPRGWSDILADEGAIFFQSQNIGRAMEVLVQDAARINPPDDAEAERARLRTNDVVVCITGARTGAVAHVQALPVDAFINQHVCLLRPRRARAEGRYLAYSLFSSAGQEQLSLAMYGLKQGLGLDQVRSQRIVLPPLHEQQRIVEWLNDSLAEFGGLMSSAESAITLLQERRAALISAAVTGKIDVRGLVQTAEAA